MRSLSSVLAVGAAALLLVGSAALAASRPAVHELTIHLPGGGIERVEYSGNVAPKIVVGSGPVESFWSPSMFDPMPSFAAFDRIEAAMDRQMNIMLRQANALAASGANGLTTADLRQLPPGTSSYTWISTSTGSGFCTRMVQVKATGNGAKPEVVSHTEGNCGHDSDTKTTNAAIPAKWDAPRPAETYHAL